jgi:hypothetical protein
MTIHLWRDRLLLTAPLFGVAFLALFNPSDDGPTVCPFALCTGLACPGCGMTRAASHLFKGHVVQALVYHPLVPLVAIQLVGGWAWFVLRRKNLVAPMPARTLNILVIGSAVSLLAVWAIRLLTGALPPV